LATQAPVKIPPVFAGGRLTVYGFTKGTRPSSVRLTATGPSGPLSFDVAVPETASDSTRTISTLAARARIRELEEGSDWLTTRGSQQKDRKANSARNEIIALSVRYGLMSRETSYVAIERRETPVTGDVKLRKVPIALTTGWGGLERVALRSPGLAMPTACLADTGAPMAPARALATRVTDSVSRSAELSSGRGPAGFLKLQALIFLQTADGTWRLTRELGFFLGHDLADLRSAVSGATGSPDEIERALATALALAWLEENAANAEDEWRLLAAKARKWLNATSAVPPDGGAWIDYGRMRLKRSSGPKVLSSEGP
jgi:Ca-activated chloride channel family protein